MEGWREKIEKKIHIHWYVVYKSHAMLYKLQIHERHHETIEIQQENQELWKSMLNIYIVIQQIVTVTAYVVREEKR